MRIKIKSLLSTRGTNCINPGKGELLEVHNNYLIIQEENYKSCYLLSDITCKNILAEIKEDGKWRSVNVEELKGLVIS